MLTEKYGHIPTDYYTRPDVLAAELERVFRPSWLCVGFAEDLKNHNDFITAAIGRYGIVVQNFKGEIQAFRNVCTHRFSRIQCEVRGNRPLTCPYHGWTFDQAGRPIGIPLERKCFGLSEAERDALALKPYAVETVGNFVFVRMTEDGPDLRGFLGGHYDILAHLGAVCTDRVENQTFEWAGNWKLAMDNAGEAYHVPLVHSENFYQILHLDFDITTDLEHGQYLGRLKDRSVKWWANVCKSIGVTRSERYQDYLSLLIFPNSILTFSYGAFLTYQMFEPMAPDRFVIKTAAWLGHNKGGGAKPMIHDALRAFTASVRADDEKILAVAQQGVEEMEAGRMGVFGAMEAQTAHFQKAYAARMEGMTDV